MSNLKALNVHVFGVSLDTVESHKGFATKDKLNYPLLADTSKKVSRAYGVLNASGQFDNRVTVIVDPKGVIRKVDDQVKPASHGKDLCTDLKSLQAALRGKPTARGRA